VPAGTLTSRVHFDADLLDCPRSVEEDLLVGLTGRYHKAELIKRLRDWCLFVA